MTETHERDTITGEAFFKHLTKKSQKKSYKNFYNYLGEVGKELGYDQPFYTFDLADVLWKAHLWRKNLPNVIPYYAVKANSDPILLRLFALLGYGFDCSTEGEIRLAIKAKGDPRKIIFAHTIKTPRAMKYASSIGVDLLTFDSKEELVKIHKHFPKSRLVLRLKSGSTQTVYNLSLKFGCDISEAEDLLLQAKELNLDVVGVSFHVGALCENPKTFTTTIEHSRLVFQIARRIGFHFTIMDIGAGFFGSKEREGFFNTLTKEINRSLEENFPDKSTRFIAEPGCYCVCSAVSVTTAIIGKKSVAANGNKNVQKEYFVNDGFYGSFFEHKEIYDVRATALLSSSKIKERPVFESKVWGQTCCSEDLILEECSLPDLEEGEFIVWENMGAYSRGVCSTFTEVPFPASRYVFIKDSRLSVGWISNLEELSDYIAEVAVLVESGDNAEEMNGHTNCV